MKKIFVLVIALAILFLFIGFASWKEAYVVEGKETTNQTGFNLWPLMIGIAVVAVAGALILLVLEQ